MTSKAFVESLVEYMKDNRHQTLKQNCKYLGISSQTYYQLCKKHGINGKIGQKASFINEEATMRLMKVKPLQKCSDTLQCNSSEDETQLFD